MATQQTSLGNCDNCGCRELQYFINKPTHQLLYCPECQLYQKGTQPRNQLYEKGYQSVYARRRRNKIITATIRLGSVTKYVDATNPRMLDIGCSVGATLAAGNHLGWQTSGVDISRSAVQFCRDNGLDSHQIAGAALPFADNTFDIVTNWHVIEHVVDINATLQEWFRVIKPGGVMVLETPDSQCLKARRLGAKYAKFWPLGHIYTFNYRNLCSLLEKQGFEMLPTRVLGKLSALPLHLSAYAAVYRGLRKLYRACGLCKSIEVCCRKPLDAQSSSLQNRAA